LEDHALVDAHVVLDLHPVADAHVVGHHHVLPQRTVLADLGARHHVAEVPDLGAVADLRALVDVGRLVDERRLAHTGTPARATADNPGTGSVTGSPFITSERCAACSTLRTSRPLAPSVRAGSRVSTARRNAWHSRRRGSSAANAISVPSPLMGTGWPSCSSTRWS